MRILPFVLLALLATSFSVVTRAGVQQGVAPMQGVPPTRESQVTMANYRDYPMSRWAFRNAGAVLHTVMVPRQGDIHRLPGPLRPELGERVVTDPQGQQLSFDALFEGLDPATRAPLEAQMKAELKSKPQAMLDQKGALMMQRAAAWEEARRCAE